jgi:hypothetical protein
MTLRQTTFDPETASHPVTGDAPGHAPVPLPRQPSVRSAVG